MLRSLFLTLLLSGSLFGCAAHAQPTLAPGTAGLSGTALTPYTARYTLQQGGQATAHARVDLTALQVQGQAAFRLTWDLHFPGQTVTDQSFFWAETLAPYQHLLPEGPGSPALKVSYYTGAQLSGAIVRPDSAAQPLAQAFAGPVFEGGMHHLVLAVTDWVPGTTRTLAVGDANGPQAMTATLENRESMTLAGRTYEAGRFTLQFAGMDMTVWITPEAPYLLRRAIPAAGFAWVLEAVLRTGDW